MAAFSSNIDITSGGTYAMDVTNGETSAKVATDLNGKFANIQELLQNGLPEVWTGDSLPDSLHNGNKIINYNGILYYGNNLQRIINTEYLNNSLSNITVHGSFQVGSNSLSKTISLGFKPKLVLIYSRYNNDDTYISVASWTPPYTSLITILTQAYTANGYSHITSNGFQAMITTNHIISDPITLYYISFK